MSDEDNTMCYVAKKSCGCTVGVAVDIPGDRKNTAKFVAEFIEDGLIITTITVTEFRENTTPFGCECEKTEALDE